MGSHATDEYGRSFHSLMERITSTYRSKRRDASLISFFTRSNPGYSWWGRANKSSPPRYRSNLRSRIFVSSRKRVRRSTASMGAKPLTSGPFSVKSVQKFCISVLNAEISFTRPFLNPIWVLDNSSVRASAWVINFFQFDRRTVFLSISSFSINPDGKWHSSILYMSMIGSMSISMEHSFSRTSFKTCIMKPSESRSSTLRDNLPMVRRVYSVIVSSSCVARACKFCEYFNVHLWQSSRKCVFKCLVLSERAPIMWMELTLPIPSSIDPKCASFVS